MADQIPDSAKIVTPGDVMLFAEQAFRNMDVPDLSLDDVDDIRDAMQSVVDRIATRAAPPAMDREAVEAEVDRIMAMPDDQIMAEADADGVAWSRGFKQGLRTGQHASTVAALVKALEWYRDQVSRVRMVHSEGDEARNALAADCGKLATDALSTLSADAIRQGEGFAWPEPKFVPVESGAKLNPERVEAAFQLINGEMVIGEQFQLVEMILDGTGYTVAPASHASDGGEA